MITIDLHCHSIFSHDCLSSLKRLLERARSVGLDRIAVTDHNTIDGALEARQIDPEGVIVGEEILTTQGELLAYYVTRSIPAHLEPERAIDMLKEQGALISVSHPFDRQRHGWKLADLLRILPSVDALEVFNSRVFFRSMNNEALHLAQEKGLPGTAGSDAHSLPEVGSAFLELPEFHDAQGLRIALQTARLHGSLSGPFVRCSSRWAVIWKRLSGFMSMA